MNMGKSNESLIAKGYHFADCRFKKNEIEELRNKYKSRGAKTLIRRDKVTPAFQGRHVMYFLYFKW